MAFDTPHTTEADLPHRADPKWARTVLDVVASAAGKQNLRHRLLQPLAGTLELRVWDPGRTGPTLIVRADTESDPGRGGDGLGLLVRVESDQDDAPGSSPPSFVRLEDDDADAAVGQIAQILAEGQ